MYLFLKELGFNQSSCMTYINPICNNEYQSNRIRKLFSKLEMESDLEKHEYQSLGFSIILTFDFHFFENSSQHIDCLQRCFSALDYLIEKEKNSKEKSLIGRRFLAAASKCVFMVNPEHYHLFGNNKSTIEYKFIDEYHLNWLNSKEETLSYINFVNDKFKFLLKLNKDKYFALYRYHSENHYEDWCKDQIHFLKDAIENLNIIKKYFPHKSTNCDIFIEKINEFFSIKEKHDEKTKEVHDQVMEMLEL